MMKVPPVNFTMVKILRLFKSNGQVAATTWPAHNQNLSKGILIMSQALYTQLKAMPISALLAQPADVLANFQNQLLKAGLRINFKILDENR